MNGLGKVFAVVFIWFGTSIAWLVLGGVMQTRVSGSAREMSERVEGLWGTQQVQLAPKAASSAVDADPAPAPAGTASATDTATALSPMSTDIDVSLDLDQRLKGLRWFSLYDVSFDGKWTFKNEAETPMNVRLAFPLPEAQGVYDDVRFLRVAPSTVGDYLVRLGEAGVTDALVVSIDPEKTLHRLPASWDVVGEVEPQLVHPLQVPTHRAARAVDVEGHLALGPD